MNMKQKISIVVIALIVSGLSLMFDGQSVSAQNFNFEDYKTTCIKGASELDDSGKEACKTKEKSAEDACANINDKTSAALKKDCDSVNLGLGSSGGQKCAGVKTSIIGGDLCSESGDGGVIFGLLKWVLRIMTAGVGIAAVGGVAWGALLYTTAESKPEQTKKAISIITNVVIGIAAYALMFVFLNYLVPGGVFS